MYRFEIELVSIGAQAVFDDIVGKPAVLTIKTDFGEKWFHGIVSSFEMTGEAVERTYYRAELMPSLWLLTHRYNSRIHQNKTVPEIISDVLTKGDIAQDRVRFDLSEREYAPREYCVQYRETDYNFICRLMEEEGIRWYFEQSKDCHVLVLDDGGAATYGSITGETTLAYRPPTGMNAPEEHVSRFRLGQSVRPGAVVLNDFSFRKPGLNLQVDGDCGRDRALEFFDYPGEYSEQKPGRDLAALRAEEFQASRIVGTGQSNSPRLTPGRTFDLAEHPGGLNGPYLLTTVTHQGRQSTTHTTASVSGKNGVLDARLHQSLIAARQTEDTAIRDLADALLQITSRLSSGDPTARRALTQWLYHAGQVSRDLPAVAEASGGNPAATLSIPNLLEDVAAANIADHIAPVYECCFECIPASVSYRPARLTPWPLMRGTQTARVVGPEGEEIHTDEYGRVKVQFNWDRAGRFGENASCWIRVSQGMAGGGYGMMFLPRVGQEVVVDFLEGDPDKPIITGRVYNADHMPPYELPKEKTKSVIKTRSSKGGGGSHEIRFEDLKGSEQMLIYGQRDLHIRFKNDRVENIERDRHLTVGNDRIELVKNNHHLKIDGNHNAETGGDESLAVNGKVSIKVAGTHSTDVQSDVVEHYGCNHKHEVSETYEASARNIKIEAGATLELRGLGGSIIIDASGVHIDGQTVHLNSIPGVPVAPPVMAQVTAPEAPEPPTEADCVQHGKDTRYDRDAEPESASPASAGPEAKPAAGAECQTSWIEIELVDEAGVPIPSEVYELKLPDGKVRRGSLDANGLAHVDGIQPGTCQICFPNLDAECWERI